MSRLRLFLATDRASLRSVFSTRPHELDVAHAPLGIPDLAEFRSELDAAGLAVVDVATDHATAIRTCKELAARYPELPVVALFCCSHSLDRNGLAALADVGTNSVLDLRLAPEEFVSALRRIAAGEGIISVRTHRTLWRDLLRSNAEQPSLAAADAALLDMLRQGKSDVEMGLATRFSPHTVKHRIEHLRRRFGARNRIELAALVGRHGIFSTESGELVGMELAPEHASVA